MPAQGDAPPPGTVLDGRYHLVDELGSGGMGIVFRAEHVRLHRAVAVKMLRQSFSGSRDLRPRFEQEAHALAALSHPNIVTVTDYGVFEERPFLVMELVEGRTLRSILDEGPLPPERALAIARQLLEGVAFAHRRGLVHRDIKPSNVLLQPLSSGKELVKILDFGFAKFVESDEPQPAGVSRTAIGFGTPAYIPPEQATGGQTDARTDVYSLGVVLFELLTGRQPFEGEVGELVHKHLTEAVPRLWDVRPEPGFAPELQAIVSRAMEKKQVDRFPDAGEMLAALEALERPLGWAPVDGYARTMVAETPVSAEQVARAKAVAHEPRPHRRNIGWLLAACVVVAVAGAAWGLSGSSAGPADPEEAGDPGAAEGPAGAEQSGEGPGGGAAAEAEDDRQRVGTVDNPWTARPVPQELAQLRRTVYGDGDVTEATIRTLRDQARRNRTDPRPSLLLGHAFVRRGWLSDAIERYELAHQMAPDARGDPRMLRNLLLIVIEQPLVASRASRTILSIYGSEAIPAIDRSLGTGGLESEAADRLRELKRRARARRPRR